MQAQTFGEGVDTWFDLVADYPELDDPVVQELDAFSRIAPSRANFVKFYNAAIEAPKPWGAELYQFLWRMNNGDYADEFRRFAGTRRQSSQVKELFSQFQQALHYYD